MNLDAIAFGCAIAPALLCIDNLLQFRTPRAAAGPVAISVVIPARNEERNIREACACVLANQCAEIELIVLDDNSTDNTASILAEIHDRRLRVIRLPPLPPGWTGKQRACAFGAEKASHDLIVFVDADVRLSPDALRRIAGFMQRERVGLGSGFPREINAGFADGLLLPLIHFLLLSYLPIRAMRWFASPSLGAGCGQLIAVTREAYLKAGGHGAVPITMHDGIMLPRVFRRAGIMTGIFDATRFARCRMYENTEALFEGLLKNATEGMAKPVALPVWTALLGLGQVLPLVLFAISGSGLAAVAFAAGIGFRLLLAVRFGSAIWSAALHPAGVAVFVAVQWVALVRQAFGYRATWRGRSYAR